MFQIGSSLREARERRGLELAAVEQDTRISARRLKALEEERFDLLPERVYTLGFLRTYADYLGLDGQQFVDELSARLPLSKESEVPLPATFPRHRRGPRLRTLAAAGLIAATAIVIGVIGLHGGSKAHPRSVLSRSPARIVTQAPTLIPPAEHPATTQVAKFTLKAAVGRCWLDARLGSQNGRELHTGTLELGQKINLSGRRIWIRLGAPNALQATLNGRSVLLPTTTPVNVVVTTAGVQAAR